jgi:CheY-like chemotaxis protein
VYSEVGHGSVFKIYLPRVDEVVAPSEAAPAPTPSRGSETILLVEDEPSLRAIAREVLEDHGYRIVEAGGGLEALDIAEHHHEPIDLLVTDVVMPRMNGRVLAEKLRQARPSLKVLYMSGYTADVIAHSGILESGTFLIEKPFTAVALLGRVRMVLGAAAGAEA